MTREEAEKYAKEMTYRDAINNLMKARSIPYRKATFIKVNELLKALEQKPYKGMTNGEVITKILKDAEWAELSSDFGLRQEDTIYIKVGGYWWNSPYKPQERSKEV